jgi:hypothetical protein
MQISLPHFKNRKAYAFCTLSESNYDARADLFSAWEQAELQRHHPGFCNTEGFSFFFISAMKVV